MAKSDPTYRTQGGATVTTTTGTPGLYDSTWHCAGCGDGWDAGPTDTITNLAQGHAQYCTANPR